MGYSFQNNVARTLYDGAADWYAFLTEALAKGWTWVAGGDGLAVYSTSANFFVGSAAGANQMGNTKAHFTIEKPAGGAAPYDLPVQICVQIGAGFGTDATRYDARVVISRGSSIDLTNADPDRCPAFDENPILGGGTDASPTFGAFSDIVTGTRNIKFGAATENFSFDMQFLPLAAPPSGHFFLDGCDQLEAGETAPFVFQCGLLMTKANLDNGTAYAFFNGSVQPLPVVTQGLPDIAVREHADSNKVTAPTFYWARGLAVAAPGGYKGTSRLYRATTASKTARQLGTKTTTDDRIVLSVAVMTDWNGDPVA